MNEMEKYIGTEDQAHALTEMRIPLSFLFLTAFFLLFDWKEGSAIHQPLRLISYTIRTVLQ